MSEHTKGSGNAAVRAGIAVRPPTEAASVTADHDRVVMISRTPDGSPAQTSDFEVIGDKQVAEDAAVKQLTEQRVSAADNVIRAVSGDTTSPGEPDPAVAEIVKAHEKAADKAETDAKAEIDEHHQGLGD